MTKDYTDDELIETLRELALDRMEDWRSPSDPMLPWAAAQRIAELRREVVYLRAFYRAEIEDLKDKLQA